MNFAPVVAEIQSAFAWTEFNLLPSRITDLLWVAFLTFGLIASTYMKNTNERLERFQPSLCSLGTSFVLAVWSILSLTKVSVFLYWNF